MSFYRVGAPVLTERLRLRQVTVADLDALHGWSSDAAVTRYLPYDPRSRAEVAAAIDRVAGLRALEHDHDRVLFAIEEGTGGPAIGELHFVLRDAAASEVELGWVIAPRVQGRGYATEAARAVLELAFACGAHRVVADLHPDNVASARVCAHLGMRQEAHFRRNFRTPSGVWEDTAVWAILADDPR